jgi:hypothetical protein
MIIKKTESGELILAVGEDRVELALHHFGKYTDKATYGITLRGRTVQLWREEGRRRAVLLTEELAEDEARRIRDDIMRVKNFTAFYSLFLYLLYIRKKLERAHADPRL